MKSSNPGVQFPVWIASHNHIAHLRKPATMEELQLLIKGLNIDIFSYGNMGELSSRVGPLDSTDFEMLTMIADIRFPISIINAATTVKALSDPSRRSTC